MVAIVGAHNMLDQIMLCFKPAWANAIGRVHVTDKENIVVIILNCGLWEFIETSEQRVVFKGEGDIAIPPCAICESQRRRDQHLIVEKSANNTTVEIHMRILV